MQSTTTEILKELEPYVYVVGSMARGTQHEFSDIDLYVRRRTEEELEEIGYYDGEGEEHYIDKVIEIFERYGVKWDSILMGYVHSTNHSPMIEASYLFRVDEEPETFPVNVLGVPMTATLDTYEEA